MSRMEDHLRAWLRAVGTLPTAKVAAVGDALWVRSDIAWPMFNGGIGTDPASVTMALEDLRDHGRPFFWWGSHDLLRDAGLAPLDVAMPWEEAPLADLPAFTLPSGLRIEEVIDEPGHRTWARTLREIHGFPAAGEQAWVEPGRLTGWGRLPWRLFTAFDDNDPVGVALMFCGGGVASLIGVGVTEDHQRRGIGRALTLAALAEATEDVAGLFATDEGSLLYRSLGFQPAGTMTRWLWMPEVQFTLRSGLSGQARAR
jgi:GNAT superfamily N-acetyltransferase